MDPDKLQKLATELGQHLEYFLKITLPVAALVSGFIVWAYEKFFIASVRESNARFKEANQLLEKERDQLKLANNDTIARLNDWNRHLEKERDELKASHSEAIARLTDWNARLEKDRDVLAAELRELRARNVELGNSLIASTDSERQNERKVDQLLTELSQFRVSGTNEVSLSSFFTDRPAAAGGGLLLFDGKLSLPPLDPRWTQVSHCDGTEATFKGGDLGIFQRMTSVDWKSIESSLPRTLQFNDMHPPNIWTMDVTREGDQNRSFFPYIQVSLISHADASLLMRSVREDIGEAGQKLQSDISTALKGIDFEYHSREPEMHTGNDPEQGKWVAFFKKLLDDWRSNPNKKLQALIDGVLPEGDRVTFSATDDQRLKTVVEQVIGTVGVYAEYPLLMLRNCIASLGKMPPETGLLIGRLLYYIFGIAGGGKIDIQHLSSSYEGAYARVRTEAEPSAKGKGLSLVTNDYVLILATKSDFCLVHVHIPLCSSEMWKVDIEAQNWMKNIRMALLK